MCRFFLEWYSKNLRQFGLISAMLLLCPAMAWADGPFLPIWQLGEFFADAGEFNASLTNAEYVYDVGGGGQWPLPIPQFMKGPSSNACHRLRLRCQLPKGCYAFVRSVKEPTGLVEMLGQVFFNGKELTCFYTTTLTHYPSPVIPGGDTCESSAGLYTTFPNSRLLCAPAGFQCIAFPFICLQDGQQEILLSMDAEVNIGETMELDAMGLISWPVTPRPHSLNEEVPGRVFLDAWGWEATVWYQRTHTVDLNYFKQNIIAESFIRGSNYQSLLPSFDKSNWYNAGWDVNQLMELLRDLHAHDMITDEHSFAPGDKTTEADMEWLENTWGPLSANSVERGWKESVDGFQGEAFGAATLDDNVHSVEMANLIWQFNPGLWASCAGYACGPKFLSKEKSRPPFYIKSPVCLNFLGFTLGPIEGKVGFLGYDDKNPVIRPFPGCGALHPESGKIYLGYQADCRINGTKVHSNPERWLGGGSTPDWILKQLDDFFRPRGLWPDDPHETAIWWLGEPPENLPLEYRDYVYAISQDPLKHALAADLAHDGVGGFLEQRKAALLQQAQNEGVDTSAAQWWKLRPRSEFPHTTRFIQNAYFRLYLQPDRDGGTLQYDLERVAHFDSDSLSLPLTEQLINTRVIGEPPPASFTQNFTVQQRGGHLAVLKARIEHSLSSSQIVEERYYQAVNDAPYLILNINRTLTGESKSIELALGCEGYNHLIADGQHYDNTVTFQQGSLPEVWQLSDTSGFKPELALLLLTAGQTSSIEWSPGQSLRLLGPANDQLQLAWVIPTDLYNSSALTQLASVLPSLVQTMNINPGGSTLTNSTGVPYTAVAKIQNPGTGPYLVQENGWWSVRGAQRSLYGTDQNDYIKVYLPAGSTARILPYGYIDGIAKPGYGCQYTVALRELTGNTQEASCTARVLSVTPYLFAPRVEFSNPISSVELNGQGWHYFDGQLVFLPNETGTYQLHVRYGTPEQPTLTRSFARIKKTDWDGCTLRLEVYDPPWAGSVSSDLYYYGTVNTLNGVLKTAEGATVVQDRGQQWLIRFRPGIVRLGCGIYTSFNPTPPNGATGVSIQTMLSWIPGQGATGHHVYLGTDKVVVTNADVGSPEFVANLPADTTSFDPPGLLSEGTTYYWRIDEVQSSGPPIKGIVWSFTTYRIPGDMDSDHDVDQEDFGFFQACYSGPGIFPTTECKVADFDSDRDVDYEDFTIFINCMGGPNNPPGC